MKLLICIAAVFTLGNAAMITWNANTKPSFCKDFECPTYTILENVNKSYDVRQYDRSYWIVTNITAINFWTTRIENSKAFFRLLGYLNGENADGVKMEMTSPVVNFHRKNQLVKAFMLPFRYYGKAPRPSTGTGVGLFTVEPSVFYVKRVISPTDGVRDRDLEYADSLKLFKEELKNDGRLFMEDRFYTAGYDGHSTKPADKYRELWLEQPPVGN